MIISKTILRRCAGCHRKIKLYEYVGLEGGWYGNHYCDDFLTIILKRPNAIQFRRLP